MRAWREYGFTDYDAAARLGRARDRLAQTPDLLLAWLRSRTRVQTEWLDTLARRTRAFATKQPA